MTIKQFFDTYKDKASDFDGYYGAQCVDLVQFYNRDVYGGPRLTGNAADVWDTYPKDSYTRVVNSPTNNPAQGDIVIWNRNAGNGAGHIAVCFAADSSHFTSLDQNWGVPQAIFIVHDYTNVMGWLHPTKQPITPPPTPTPTTGTQYKGYDLTNQDSMKVAVDVLVRVQAGEFIERSTYIKKTIELQEQIKGANEERNRARDALTQIIALAKSATA